MTNITLSQIDDELQNLITRRMQILHESAQESVTVMAIQVMRSLRAATPKSSGSIIPPSEEITNTDLGIAIKECSDLFVSWDRYHKPCIRQGGMHGKQTQIKPWYRIDISRWTAGKVFLVTLSIGRQQAWKKQPASFYIVAYSESHAKKEIENRYNKIAGRYAGLYKDGWSRAMMITSNRPSSFISSDKSKSVLERNGNIVVRKNTAGNFASVYGDYTVEVENNLKASGTIVGGDGAVSTAMMKACNAVNGYINKYISKTDPNQWFAELKERPFPESAFETA